MQWVGPGICLLVMILIFIICLNRNIKKTFYFAISSFVGYVAGMLLFYAFGGAIVGSMLNAFGIELAFNGVDYAEIIPDIIVQIPLVGFIW
jgi:hypothetical protein